MITDYFNYIDFSSKCQITWQNKVFKKKFKCWDLSKYILQTLDVSVQIQIVSIELNRISAKSQLNFCPRLI